MNGHLPQMLRQDVLLQGFFSVLSTFSPVTNLLKLSCLSAVPPPCCVFPFVTYSFFSFVPNHCLPESTPSTGSISSTSSCLPGCQVQVLLTQPEVHSFRVTLSGGNGALFRGIRPGGPSMLLCTSSLSLHGLSQTLQFLEILLPAPSLPGTAPSAPRKRLPSPFHPSSAGKVPKLSYM